ncbi:2-amino-4-hydroxy-6-hydroxymethyldihydropteridine diphosphokinase [Halothiobacillus sp. DCM-1]|uniref:2-amino-4-hydroxy-6- hydroxymethyldihydropteridine diphosphokinase n=1 Tax=Halothiobacillus sp. DCM-1 TaxID=3112558 RepID=UPI003243EB90
MMSGDERLTVDAFIALGSNLDDPVQQIRRALRQLDTLPGTRLCQSSSLYTNPPIGPQDQPEFVNAVAQVSTSLSAQDLLAALKSLEKAAGRRLTRHWGERVLDLDLLTYGSLVSADPILTLPHPGIAQRRFVLLPWLEIAPDAQLPDGRSIQSLLADAPAHPLHRLDARQHGTPD